MAGRILNRRALREQAEQVEQNEAEATTAEGTVAKPKKQAKAKTPAAPKKRKPRAKKAAPRMRARWGIFDNSAKQVAIFDYPERAAADEKLAALLANKKGLYYLQMVKEPMPELDPLQPPPAV